MKKIKINYEDHQSEIDTGGDQEDVEHSLVIDSIEIVGKDPYDYSELETPLNIIPGQDYFLLIVYYSTGDSFHNENGFFDFVEIYDDYQLAKKNAEKIKSHPKQESITITNGLDQEYKISTPWTGYFEHIENVDVKKVFCK